MIAVAKEPTEYAGDASLDCQIYSAAKTALGTSKYTAVRQLNCRVLAGVVEITGTVPSFYLKQLAQAAVLQLHPLASVRNLVEVNGESPVLIATNCSGH